MRLVHLAAVLAIAATASAQHTTVTGPGSPIPTAGTGGGSTYPTLPANPGTSTLTVPADVTSVTSIEVAGLTHSWIGDLQMVLYDPNGVGHLIFLRPGYLNTGAAGNSGDFNGDYEFVESGGLNLPDTSATSTSPPPGTYNQTFTSGGVMWVDGDQGIFNTPMTSIAGPAGDWTLVFYDWAAGDIGGFTSWTLNCRTGSTGPGVASCFGDGSGAPCGCGNEIASTTGGCRNGLGVGAVLSATGTADTTADTLGLTADLVTAQPGLMFQGSNLIGGGTGATFGDGIRCCGQNVVRLEILNGAMPQPTTVTTTITVSGHPGQNTASMPGSTFCYQYWYRNPGTSPCGSNFNFSNAVTVLWS